MKRRQFLKMVPVGVGCVLFPVKSEPENRIHIVDEYAHYKVDLDKFAEINGIARRPGITAETDFDLRERLLYKIKEPVTYT